MIKDSVTSKIIVLLSCLVPKYYFNLQFTVGGTCCGYCFVLEVFSIYTVI